MLVLLTITILIVHGVFAGTPATPKFNYAKVASTITNSDIDEASGLAASRLHPEVLYTQNDKGDTNRIFAVNSKTGSTLAELTIAHISNYDWEDLAVGPCGSHTCIYIAETGDHAGDGSRNIIYRVREPVKLESQTLSVDSELHFIWDQPDCETVMVAPNEDVYVVSKVNHAKHAVMAKLPKNGWGSKTQVSVEKSVMLKQTSNRHDPVGGDISPDGKEMLIKYKEHVYYWYVPLGDYIGATSNPPAQLPYHPEVRGESCCWDAKGSGYFTTTEGHNPILYYYARTTPILG